MGQLLLLLVVALTVGAVVFGVTVLVSGGDQGLAPAEPDGRAVPLPGTRPLIEGDVAEVRFDTALRGYRMEQVDQALRRAAYDIGYKDELIGVLEAEVIALRDGRSSDAELLRQAREAALGPAAAARTGAATAGPVPAGAATGFAAGQPAPDASTGTAVALLEPPADDRDVDDEGAAVPPADVAGTPSGPVDVTKAGRGGGTPSGAATAAGAEKGEEPDAAKATETERDTGTGGATLSGDGGRSDATGAVAEATPAGAGGTAEPDAIPASRAGDADDADGGAVEVAGTDQRQADEATAGKEAGPDAAGVDTTGKAGVDRK